MVPRAAAQFLDPMQNIGVRPELLKDVGVDQKLNDSIPLDLTFRDEHGKTVELAQYFGSKPVILTLVYYNCPMLCTQVLNGLDRSLEAYSDEYRQGFQRRDGQHRSDRAAGARRSQAGDLHGNVRASRRRGGLAFSDRR